MKTLLLLALTMAFGLLQTHGVLHDFRRMVHLLTGKNFVSSYSSYGCYCITGGKGLPKDATDQCCATHSRCYHDLQKQRCGTKGVRYTFTYQKGQIICAKQNFCRRQLCQCDRTAAMCLARNLKSYSNKYKNYNKSRCCGRAHNC
ncbi:phospholipase A2, membrane associated-like [Pteronotus mesoamericanus]|uniref:phospholipase A2, membrane associated-like n=1 Tax=Pteronotus mesoamericanus TaxID=1884717 RepID=UPI0023EDDAE4|nr:phospholipase A2, membrane associated-like [Pteronotus parnellii mesoamericanus]